MKVTMKISQSIGSLVNPKMINSVTVTWFPGFILCELSLLRNCGLQLFNTIILYISDQIWLLLTLNQVFCIPICTYQGSSVCGFIALHKMITIELHSLTHHVISPEGFSPAFYYRQNCFPRSNTFNSSDLLGFSLFSMTHWNTKHTSYPIFHKSVSLICFLLFLFREWHCIYKISCICN